MKSKVPLLIGLGLAAAWALGGSRQSKAAGSGPHIEPGGTGPGGTGTGDMPVSDQMLFNSNCTALIVRVDMEAYDQRITEMYWNLRRSGYCSPVDIAAEILRADAPQCAWPATDASSEQAKIIWQGTLEAVTTYMTMEDPRLHETELTTPCFEIP